MFVVGVRGVRAWAPPFPALGGGGGGRGGGGGGRGTGGMMWDVGAGLAWWQ